MAWKGLDEFLQGQQRGARRHTENRRDQRGMKPVFQRLRSRMCVSGRIGVQLLLPQLPLRLM